MLDAGSLAKKKSKEVEKILGPPIETWTPRSGLSGLMQSYPLGDEMIMEFQNGRIDSFVIFFSRDVSEREAHQLIGLSQGNLPSGVKRTTTGSNWIKVFY